ncbi:YkgJ family cysteine cluster protein [Clostridium algidicarnis]|uniref:YkgJ family cysteine cluster protein n=2 Tax=Clostridium algidicarnis TaxID=37659 RepID=UPI003FD7C89C
MGSILMKEKKVKIKDQNLCLCNSGKAYEDCCKLKKQEYYTLGKNYEDKDIIFNHTFNMEVYDEITDYAMYNIFDLEGQSVLTISKSIEILNNIYEKVNRGMNQFVDFAACKKGCSSCCSLYVDLTAIEAENIRRYIVDNKSDDEINVYKTKLKEIKEKVETTSRPYELSKEDLDNLHYEYALKDIPCMFLKKDGSCSVYEARPLSCRKFIVFSSRDKCEDNVSKVISPNLASTNIGRLAIDHLSMITGRYKNLIYINEGDKSPIKRPLIQWIKEDFDDINRQP